MSKPQDPKDPLPKVPPFYESKTTPRRTQLDMRGLLSIAMMFVSLAALTLALGAAALMAYAVFTEGLANSLDGLWAKLIVVGMTYAFGWAMALVSIRGFANLIYPLIIKIYAWGCLAAIAILYLKVIQKLFTQQYDTTKLVLYVLMLLGGLVALIGLHLLVEGHDLRPFAIPLLIISVLQLFAIVFRYVFFFTPEVQATKLLGDLLVFFLMISISALMLMHLGLLSGLRSQIDNLFSQNGNGNGKPKDDRAHWV
jgi:hypothetical protein